MSKDTGVLIEDYSNIVYRSLAREVLGNFLLKYKRFPFYIPLDASILHIKPWTSIIINPHIKTKKAWKTIVERYYESDSYKRLNDSVKGDPLLAKYATIHWLNSLFEKAEEESKNIPTPQGSQPIEHGNIEGFLNALDTQVSPSQASRIINRIVSTLEKEAEKILEDIDVISSFTHAGIPVAKLLERPDEFREKARNKVIVHLVKFLRKLRREAPSLSVAKMPTLIGGRPLGVKRLQRWSELPRIIPIDYVDDDILSYKIASKTARVPESYGSIPDYVIYLDKSGSMAGSIVYREPPGKVEYVPKISFAAASALALAQRLRSVGAKMTLKLFDTDVHDPITDFAQLIETLLKIQADSGTNISNVLEDALKYRDERIIVVTDGIDEVSEESVRKAKSANLDISFIFIKTDNSLLKKNFHCIYLEEAKPSILLEV